MKKTKWTASPYLVWMVAFIAVPLAIVVYFAFTDKAGHFTLENIMGLGAYTVAILQMMVATGLVNTLTALILVYTAQGLPLAVFILSEFMRQVSDDLKNAGRIDGMSEYAIFFKLVLPLVRPGMVAAFFLIFLPALRELTVSVMLYGTTSRTIGVAIYTLNEDGETVTSAALAGIALILIVTGQSIINHFAKSRQA